MTISRRRFISISAAAAGATLLPGGARATPPLARWSGVAMGASASLMIRGLSDREATTIITAVRAEIARMDRLFSLHRDDSALVRLNRDGGLRAPPFDMLRLLGVVDAVHAATDGAFDPTVQPLWAAHAEVRGLPSPGALAAAQRRVGWRHVRVSPQRIAFARPGMAMTLNGIAQGYATDRVADVLRAAGLRDVLASVGEIVALGERSPGAPWRIGLAERGDDAPHEEITLTDAAVATSAPLGTLIDPAHGVGHILDPRGTPVTSRWRRVSVIHPSATIADALSTAFVLASRQELDHALAAWPDARVIAVDTAGRRHELLA